MTLVVLERYPAPGHGPAGLAWDGHALWHADRRAGAIYRLSEQAVVSNALFSPGNLGGLAWDGRSLWQAAYDESLLRRIDPQTNDFDQTILLPDAGWLSGVAWDGALLWVVAQQQGRLLAVEPDSGRIIRELPAPVAGGDLDAHDGTLWLSVASPMRYDAGAGGFEWLGDPAYAVLQIDPADGRVVAQHAAEGLYTGLAWATGTLWLASAATGELLRAEIR
jgi:hypothetical protein